MAAAGGHWVKGTFQPAGGNGAGGGPEIDRLEERAVSDPDAMEELFYRWVEEVMPDDPDIIAKEYNNQTEERAGPGEVDKEDYIDMVLDGIKELADDPAMEPEARSYASHFANGLRTGLFGYT